jgi:putative transposase
MTSKPVAWLLANLGVTRTHSRPQGSHDLPPAAAQCNTLTYHPNCPERCGSLDGAGALCQPCFDWSNTEHRHSGIGRITPAMGHDGRPPQVMEGRAKMLQAAFEAHPERFKGKQPAPFSWPEAVWIHRPLAVLQGVEAESMASRQSFLNSGGSFLLTYSVGFDL